ncbi:hypothetical protein AAFN88_08560 [Pelagibius sp. CAU 1746]|uniref:hypothetical protein n=1 Tax=Pelagibius sp. CAU 1746 TaxID=3140370 RepID=UPI00325B1F44
MLDEAEWVQVEPPLSNAIKQIKRYRTEHGVSLAKARRDGYGKERWNATSKSLGTAKRMQTPFGTIDWSTLVHPA